MKIEKYQSLIANFINNGWKIDSFIVITTEARSTTLIYFIKFRKIKLEIPKNAIKHTLKKNTIAIQHIMSIILHKRRKVLKTILPIRSCN